MPYDYAHQACTSNCPCKQLRIQVFSNLALDSYIRTSKVSYSMHHIHYPRPPSLPSNYPNSQSQPLSLPSNYRSQHYTLSTYSIIHDDPIRQVQDDHQTLKRSLLTAQFDVQNPQSPKLPSGITPPQSAFALCATKLTLQYHLERPLPLPFLPVLTSYLISTPCKVQLLEYSEPSTLNNPPSSSSSRTRHDPVSSPRHSEAANKKTVAFLYKPIRWHFTLCDVGRARPEPLFGG